MLPLIVAAITTASLLMPCPTFAAPGDLDLSFDAGSGVDGVVRAMVVQPDGKILICGDFRTVKGFVKTGIARLNTDGSNDTNFNATVGITYSGYFQAIALQPDGKVLIGGQFDYVNGVSRTNIARLNADGTLDTTFDSSKGIYGNVNTFALQTDGKVLIGGNFTKVNGITRNYLARLNANGSLDTSFNPGTAAVGSVNCIAVQTDGKVLFGAYDRMARLNTNGVRDTSFNANVNGIDSIALQPDGKVIIGGGFSFVNGVVIPTLARLNANGSLDTSFGDPSASPGFLSVRSIALQSDGKVIIGGGFSTVQRTTRFGIARLNAGDGTLDDSFDPSVLLRDNWGRVGLVAVQPDGKVLIAGEFKTVNGVSRYGIARLHPDASLDMSFNSGSGVNSANSLYDYSINAIAAQADGKVLMGGAFDGVGGLIRSRIARLNPNGNLDASFDPKLFPYPLSADDPAVLIQPTVQAVRLQPDGKILVGSISFDWQGTEWTCDLARLNADGTLDAGFNPVQGTWKFTGSPLCLALQTDGKIILGGSFDSLNGAPLRCITRLAPDGNLDPGFNASVTHDVPNYYPLVQSVAPQPGGKVIIAGSFTTVNGFSQTNFARLNSDGSLDSSFDSTFGTNGVRAVIAQPDGKLLVFADRIARLNADGTVDLTFSITPNPASAAVLQPDGKIIVNGGYVNGVSRILVRLNTDGSLDPSFDSSGDGAVDCMALLPDGRLLIGGRFASIDGFARNYVARLFWGDPAVPASRPVKEGGDFVALFKGTPGLTYTVETSATISSGAWEKWVNRTAPTNDLGSGVGVFELRDPIAPSGQRFYRAIFPAH